MLDPEATVATIFALHTMEQVYHAEARPLRCPLPKEKLQQLLALLISPAPSCAAAVRIEIAAFTER